MSLFEKLDIGAIKQSAEQGIKRAQEGLANIKVDEIAQGAVDAAKAGMEKIDVGKMSQDAKNLADAGASAVTKAVEGITGKTSEKEEPASFKEFASLLWCLASVDGETSDMEREKLNELMRNLDSNFDAYAEAVERECFEKLHESSKEFGWQTAAKIEAQKIVEKLEPTSRDAKLLCWNLLAIANVDGLSDAEADFIRFTSTKAGIQESTFEELRNYSDAIVDIENARDQLKGINRNYGEIEPIMSEYAKREQKIAEAAQALIADR